MGIVVAGAGTAGWMAALYTKKYYPSDDVTVVYDDKTPIIGVGEGTTPHFVKFMRDIDIHIPDLIKNCDATIKNGIKFTNWKGDGTHYHHAFSHHDHDIERCTCALMHGIDIDKLDVMSTLSENNKVPETVRDFVIHINCQMGIHFDAKKMAEYLQKVGIDRGIKVVVGKIEDAKLDKDGYVTEIVLDTQEKLKTDFIFDCTGFSRYFVKQIYKSPVKSYEKILPCKRAMPFFIDRVGTVPPYTEAIAMKYGWMWKIPVGNRYGCGYVFDSDLVTDEEVYEEICSVTNQKPHIRKKINFKPEFNAKPFNKNTLALGLSHGFLEPMEATSLMMTIIMLQVLINSVPRRDIFDRIKRESYTEDYNRYIQKMVNNCVDMISIHYLTPRNDTEFWRNFKKDIPESVKRILTGVNDYDVKSPNFIRTLEPFHANNIVKCMAGVDYISRDMIEKNGKILTLEDIKKTAQYNQELSDLSEIHDDFLNKLSSI